MSCRSMANANVNMNFNAFLEKNKLKDDSSNDADWIRDPRIILIAERVQNTEVSYIRYLDRLDREDVRLLEPRY